MKTKDITKVITQGRAYKSSSFLLKIGKEPFKGPDDLSKTSSGGKSVKNIAILCSKKVFKTAVIRNKARRRIRSAYLAVKKELGDRLVYKNTFLVFTAHDTVLTVDFLSLKSEMRNILEKSGMLKF